MAFIQDNRVITDDRCFDFYDNVLTSIDEDEFKEAAKMVEAISRKPFDLDSFQRISRVIEQGWDGIENMLTFELKLSEGEAMDFMCGGVDFFQDEDFTRDIFIENNLHPFCHYFREVAIELEKRRLDYLKTEAAYEIQFEETINLRHISAIIWAKVLKDSRGQYKFKTKKLR